jgi:hypothetical protein
MKTKMKLGRDTKGTYVYETMDEDAKSAPIRSLYIARSAIKGDAPEEITIEIKEIGK